MAIVTPLMKKSGLDTADMASYRPVSNLSFISKTAERIVAQQLNQYLLKNAMMPSLQSAYCDVIIPPRQRCYVLCLTSSPQQISNMLHYLLCLTSARRLIESTMIYCCRVLNARLDYLDWFLVG